MGPLHPQAWPTAGTSPPSCVGILRPLQRMRNLYNKILIVGFGGCGKDEAGAFFHQHMGLRCVGSTSWIALPLMAEKLNLPEQRAWETRRENRLLWKDTLDEYRAGRPARLMEEALNRGAVVVTGVRDKCEIDAAKELGLFRHILWIDRPGIPPDATVTFTAGDCTDFVLNDGSLRRFYRNLTRWAVSVNLDGVRLSTFATELLLDATP